MSDRFNKNTNLKSLAFDSHLHILPIDHVCLSSYYSFIRKNALEESFAVATSADYIFKSLFPNTDELPNVLSVMENKPAAMLMLLEDDLRGKFGDPKERKNLIITDDGLNICGTHYDYLVLTPLIMDFELPDFVPDAYYDRTPKHDLKDQALDILGGMQIYRKERPGGKLIVRPYFGMNPHYRTGEEIEGYLHNYFDSWSPLGKEALKTWDKLPGERIRDGVIPNNSFTGIKLYPPLNFDPWPDDYGQREKLKLLYSYCEKKQIPIITHCDDQGFRVLRLDESFKVTSPERWALVLEEYPDLYLDIAHFGKQYYKGMRFRPHRSWEEMILELILKYPNVYSDFSFTGFEKPFWDTIGKLLASYTPDEAETIADRLLFGTDWPLCLMKIDSAYTYWDQFITSSLPDAVKQKFLNGNPVRFHFRES
ncbi:amidohydrolase [Brucepastera parasyntrophica]|uniref:amidohydrolase family protein n=1 Tax=Brucepastera parasyntrophica TaxID=2880008 RepID=UPI00210951B3|nr:amidohydrolase family protein [Brucepastera parasyntrophica]ULQ58764.1 amidohydrolase [Brucepastera parasyntrophica]